jgi:hypothetical protein
MKIFLIVLALAVLLLTAGETIGSRFLTYASLAAFSLLIIWIVLRGTSNLINYQVWNIFGRGNEDDLQP